MAASSASMDAALERARGNLREPLAQPADRVRQELAGGEVVRLPGIVPEVVELRHGKVDELVRRRESIRAAAPSRGSSVAESDSKYESPGTDSPRAVREQRAAVELRRLLDAEHVEDRRDEIDVAGVRGVAARRDEVRAPEHQRNVERRLVGEEPVRQLAVVAARFAVVARDDEERRGPRRRHRVEQRGEGGVRERDLAEVEIVREARLATSSGGS